MATAEGPRRARSARSLVWARRRAAIACALARRSARNRQGMIGLACLRSSSCSRSSGRSWSRRRRSSPPPPAACRSSRPRSATRSAPTTSGGRCSSLMIVGARISLLVGFTAAFGAMLIGATVVSQPATSAARRSTPG